MKLRKTSAGIQSNEAETKSMDQLGRTQNALTPKAAKAMGQKPASRDGWSKARKN
jgi:hypothetical protein